MDEGGSRLDYDNLPEEWKNYAGRWIACIGGRLVGQGGTPHQAQQAAASSRHKETPRIVYVPTPNPLIYPDLFERIRAILPANQTVYLVGGAVRDALSSRPAHDLDFALAGNPARLARRVANELGGAFFLLDDERNTGRVVLAYDDQSHYTLDFAVLRGETIEDDLRSRDFSINAMAVDTRSPQQLLDPLGGAVDLSAGRLRACSPGAMQEDPVRILRGIRLAAAHAYRLTRETKTWMRQSVGSLQDISPERCRDELFRILEGAQPASAVRALEMLGVFPYLLPELASLKGVTQSPPHVADVWEHTLMALRKLEVVFSTLEQGDLPNAAADPLSGLLVAKLGHFQWQISHHLREGLNPNRSLRGLLFFAALYHDAAKPVARQVEEDGRIRALGHEQLGAEMIAARSRALMLSKAETERLEAIVRQHMRVHGLAQLGQAPTRRAIYRFFRDSGEAGVDVCLLSLADMLATYGDTIEQADWAAYLDVVHALLEAWWEKPAESVRPAALINGDDLKRELGMAPGPEIGGLLEAVREAQATGQVHDRDEALALAREQRKPHGIEEAG